MTGALTPAKMICGRKAGSQSNSISREWSLTYWIQERLFFCYGFYEDNDEVD